MIAVVHRDVQADDPATKHRCIGLVIISCDTTLVSRMIINLKFRNSEPDSRNSVKWLFQANTFEELSNLGAKSFARALVMLHRIAQNIADFLLPSEWPCRAARCLNFRLSDITLACGQSLEPHQFSFAIVIAQEGQYFKMPD